MSTIIRATDTNNDQQRVAFNFDDITVQANQYLDKVRGEAVKIIAKAQADATALRKQAAQAGEQEAQRTARQGVETMVQTQLATVLPALRQAVEEIQHAKQAWLKHWEAVAVHVAAAIARRLVRRELERHPEITLTLVREALELAAGNSQLRIHIHPQDHKALGGQIEMLTKEVAGLATTELVPDPDIACGGCRVETQFGTIDQQFDAQLQRIEEELRQ
jgi:flagellar assembly protein FliH